MIRYRFLGTSQYLYAANRSTMAVDPRGTTYAVCYYSCCMPNGDIAFRYVRLWGWFTNYTASDCIKSRTFDNVKCKLEYAVTYSNAGVQQGSTGSLPGSPYAPPGGY